MNARPVGRGLTSTVLTPLVESLGTRIKVFDSASPVVEAWSGNFLAREIATKGGGDAPMDYCHPAWSPNSDRYLSYVAAWSYAEVPCLGQVLVANDTLEHITTISENAAITQQPWSPSGDRIVITENGRSPWWAPSRTYIGLGEGAIWILSADGTSKRLITDENGYDGEAVWRP